jgi:uncharacterized protein (TIGR03546 family)
MLILKFLQSLAKTLHSDGTPGQIAAGFALGAALGLTPLLNAHNLVVITALALLNVSFASGMLAMAVFAPLGFALDPLFDRIGHSLLVDNSWLRPIWERLDQTPVLAATNLNNTVVLGSVLVWLLLTVPLFVAARFGVDRYRVTLGARLRETRIYHTIVASQVYNVYRWFRP